VTETDFGWHVILLEERLPEQRFSDQELRPRVLDDVILERAGAETDQLLKALSSRRQVQIERNAAEGMGLVVVEP
jgi:parvulin-like peptidyl-prolyl isomerase